MVFRWRTDDGPILNQGIPTIIAMKLYIFVIFQGWGYGWYKILVRLISIVDIPH